jgi:putative ABC transport system substrate-binding protein
MRRREFLGVLGGTVASWPMMAHAQRPSTPVIGFLSSLVEANSAHLVAGFHLGLSEAGFVSGQNVAIEFRWAEGRYDRLRTLAADLVERRVAVLVSTGGHPTVVAAKAATTSIPIVFASGFDPVEAGIVASLNRPGGNLTGVHVLTTGLEAKRLGLLNDLLPAAASVAVLINPQNPNNNSQLKDVQDAARDARRAVHVVHATGKADLAAAFARIAEIKPGALLAASDPALSSLRQEIVDLAAQYAIPTIYQWRDFAEAGGLMSYGTDLPNAYREVGVYVGRVLKGAKPGDLPVVRPTKFELVINLKTAKALGLMLPSGLLSIADKVIE